MRHAEARALYPTQTTDTDRQQVQTLLDQLDAADAGSHTDRPRVDDRLLASDKAEGELRSRLHDFVGRDLETDQLIHQHHPDLLNQAQLSRMRAAGDLLHADAEYRERDRHDDRGHVSQQDADGQRRIAEQARDQAGEQLAAGNSGEATRLGEFAADVDDRADEYAIDADHDWDTAEQRETRGRVYEACGNAQAAEARKLADTAQATPPWKAVLKRSTPRRTTRRGNTSPGRQRNRADRGR